MTQTITLHVLPVIIFTMFFTTMLVWFGIDLARIVKLEEKNEAQRLMIEEMQKPVKPKNPSRIEVRTFDDVLRVVYGGRMIFSDDILQIITHDDYIAAVFARGGWMSAIVVNKERQKEKADDQQGDVGKLVHVSQSDAGAAEAVRGDQGGSPEIRRSDSGEHAAERGSDGSGAKDS